MARTITTVVSPLTAAPSITKPPSADTYPAEAQAFMDWSVAASDKLSTLATSANAAAADLRALADDVTGDADAASTSAATAATQVTLAAGQVTLATAQADRALQYAQQAQVEAPGAWAAGTSYTFPTVAVGSDGNTYRCMGTGVVGVDPIYPSPDWTRLTGAGGGSPVFNYENFGGF